MLHGTGIFALTMNLLSWKRRNSKKVAICKGVMTNQYMEVASHRSFPGGIGQM